MEDQSLVLILLASYNGGKYISEQIESIINQTYPYWKLIIRDDGSTDNTISIIEKFCLDDNRILLCRDEQLHIGAKNSFMKLLSNNDSDLYMFCDQDDIWLPNKIEISLNAYKEAALSHPNTPIIVHTDATVVDSELRELAHSYWSESHINPETRKDYNLMAIECCVQGTTMLFNQEAKKASYPLADDVRMHDFWVTTRVLRKGGYIKSVYEPTILYRQHGSNVYGVSYGKNRTIASRLSKFTDIWNVNKNKYAYLKNDGYGSIFKFIYYRIKLYGQRYFG